jgi:eukaryotic-like serine/threonine-protein kinase
MRVRVCIATLLTLSLSSMPHAARRSTPATASLAGTWVGEAHHAGESSRVILSLEPDERGALRAYVSLPAIHMWRSPSGSARISSEHVAVGPLDFVYDRSTDTLTTTLPDAMVPVHRMPVVLRRAPAPVAPPRREIAAPIRQPAWVKDLGSPIWSDVLADSDLALVGSDDGRLHALDARSGTERWTFRAGGAVRARPTRLGDDVVFQADEGMLYRVRVADGVERWRVRIAERPAIRLALGDPKSRYENRASAAAVADGRIFVGTHAGHLLALDADTGRRAWDVKTGDSIVATPLVTGGRVVVGSFDGRVYAVDAGSGAQVWQFDTHGAVTDAACAFDGNVIVGSRSYDLVALDAGAGRPVWSRYFWFSWVESPATIARGIAYLGSSDAAALHAFDAHSGRTVWRTDVGGSAWGQPLVTDDTVYEGTVGTLNYLVDHRAFMIAVNRRTGRPVWQYPLELPAGVPPGELTPWGFAGSAGVAGQAIVIGALDGRVYGFRR